MGSKLAYGEILWWVINKPRLVQTGGCLGQVWMTLLCDKPDVVKRVVVWLGLGDIVAIDHLLRGISVG